MNNYKLCEITEIKEEDYDGQVFDLEVEEDASYNIEGIIVHNSGASCITRRVIGYGVPQLTAIMDCASALKTRDNVRLIADGGIRDSGDVIKALWGGADTVMCGYVLAGHTECPTFEQGKIYRGMSSRTVHQRQDVAAEGVAVRIENKGSVKELVRQYAQAIKAACAMGNAHNLEQLRRNVRAVRVSTMSNEESEPVNELG